MKPFVQRLQVENFACIKSVDLTLTRLHAFIGPNGSGKSTLLRAAKTVMASSVLDLMQLAATGTTFVTVWNDGNELRALHTSVPNRPATAGYSGAQLIRLDPDALRAPAPLIERGDPITFFDERGRGLAAIFDAMLSREPTRFITLSDAFAALFPGVARFELHGARAGSKSVGATLTNGKEIGAEALSEGMLYWLAFKALQYAQKPAMLLVEEPENGLHPARIKEVVGVLREISQETQVLIATHSPLVINELAAEEVTLITATAERGTIATPMAATKNFEQRKSVYSLGELWLSYADGDVERNLMPDPKDTKAAG